MICLAHIPSASVHREAANIYVMNSAFYIKINLKARWFDIFDNAKFITNGVEKNIPKLLQIIMWELIENLPLDKDYLQVFSLEPDVNGQRVIHTQEEPDYKREYVFGLDTVVVGKVFVIDDGTHSTMLMSNEY